MEEYIVKGGKKLRLGYTTGSCAAAAAKAAAYMLLTGRRMERVTLATPKGIRLELEVKEISMGPDAVSCAIEKDSGDDPDVTRGTLVFAEVSRHEAPGVAIDGGVGVGRVTKPGLDQPVGAAAINSVPRRMILEAVEEVRALTDSREGLKVVISVPAGEALAKRTFNPRLGIAGGISILGTTGIVEPMSEQALVDTIRVELRQRRESGAEYVLLTPGNYGSDFIRDGLGIDPAGADLQFHRRRAGHLPGAGLPGSAAGGTYRQAGEAGGGNVQYPLPIRGLPDGDHRRPCRRCGTADGAGEGDTAVRGLRRRTADTS